jgi:hypothetical protein
VLARELETGTFRYAWTQGFGDGAGRPSKGGQPVSQSALSHVLHGALTKAAMARFAAGH